VKVHFGTPTTGSPRIEWCTSVMQMVDHEMNKGPADRLLDVRMQFQIGAYISKNRNAITAGMYRNDADAVLMIDHDQGFPPDTLERMVFAMESTGRGVVAGNVVLQANAPTTGFEVDDTGARHFPVRRELGDDTKLVDTIASSCVLVHRRVFDKISAHVGDPKCSGPPWFGPGTWWMLSPVWDEERKMWIERGEDFSFSWRVREIGEAPMLLMWDLGLTHHKPVRLESPEPVPA
jgi:hypothetical protein